VKTNKKRIIKIALNTGESKQVKFPIKNNLLKKSNKTQNEGTL
jgi:hypothetical protein